MKQAAGNQAAILIVEDDQVTLEMMTNVLAGSYRIRTASDGAQCLEILKDFKPDMILMDVGLPVISGIETCIKLRADAGLQNIPVVFVTAEMDDETLEAAFKAGASDCLLKPVNRVELLTRVRCALTYQQANQKLAEKEKLKAALETAGGICHKLNQPLQFVLGSLQILMMDLEHDEPKYKQIEAILEHVEKMGEITRNLADITRYRTRQHAGGQDILDIDQCLKNSRTDQ